MSSVRERAYLHSVTSTAAATDPLESAFRANAKVAYSIAARILGSADDAEDLLQDLYLIARRDLREIGHPAAVRQWFATATVRLARRRLQRRRIFSFFAGEQHYDGSVATDASPEQHALLTAVFRVLQKLPVAPRVAWTLRHVQGMQLATVAETCECSLATAKRRIAEAQTFIEEALNDA